MRSTFPLILALLLSAAPARAQESREARWRADLEYLGTQLEIRHPDLHHALSREEFRAGLDDIAERIPALSDDGVALALARLLARVGDGHTTVPLLWDDSLGFRRLPIQLVRTADGVSVLAADRALEGLAGSRVLRIGGLPAPAALDSVATLVSHDNDWTAYADAADYAAVPEILHGLGIADSPDRVRLVVEDPAGSRREVLVEAAAADTPVEWDYGAFGDSAPWLSRREDPYWLAVLPGDSVAYVQYNRADRDKEEESVTEFGQRLLGLVKQGGIRRIVVDLRWNHGGARWRARHLLGALVAAEYELGGPRSSRSREPDGHLVTLIGPGTFSAANLFALDLDLHTNTAFVGLPTGGKPNDFGEMGRFRLPNSGLEIRHSVYYRQATHPRDTRPAIFPDQRVEWTAADVSEGRDPVLERALSWRPLPSAIGELERRIDANGVAPALAWLDSLAAAPVQTLRVSEAEVNRLGYDLLKAGRTDAATAVLGWNLDTHPWSANAHDSLADAYLAAGREAEADRLLCQAFALDPQFDRALDRGVDCGPRRPTIRGWCILR